MISKEKINTKWINTIQWIENNDVSIVFSQIYHALYFFTINVEFTCILVLSGIVNDFDYVIWNSKNYLQIVSHE